MLEAEVGDGRVDDFLAARGNIEDGGGDGDVVGGGTAGEGALLVESGALGVDLGVGRTVDRVSISLPVRLIVEYSQARVIHRRLRDHKRYIRHVDSSSLNVKVEEVRSSPCSASQPTDDIMHA